MAQHNQAIEALCEIGFTSYEAKVYLALLESSPSTAYEISKTSGVPHAKVYETLRKLSSRGIVRKTAKKPVRYAPLDSESLVRQCEAKQKKALDNLEASLKGFRYDPVSELVWHIESRDRALERAAMMVGSAESHVLAGIWDPELEELDVHLEKAASRGVRVMLVIYGESEPKYARFYHHSMEHALHRASALGRELDLVIDGKEALTGRLGGGAGCQMSWSRNPGLVDVVSELVRHDIYLAEIMMRFGPEIEDAFGPDMAEVRKTIDLNEIHMAKSNMKGES